AAEASAQYVCHAIVFLGAFFEQEDGPNPERKQHDITHHRGGRNEEDGTKHRHESGEKGPAAIALCQRVSAPRGGACWKQKDKVQRRFARANNRCRNGDEVGSERWILECLHHCGGVAEPIDVKAVKIERMLLDLLRGADEEGVVDMKRLVQE